MNKLLPLTLIAMLFSCGDAGLQFNVSREVSQDIPIGGIDISGSGGDPGLPPENPDPVIEIFDYELSDDFDDDNITDLGNEGSTVELNSVSYEILDVDGAEEGIALDQAQLVIDLQNGDDIVLEVISGGVLTNTTSKVLISELTTSQKESLAQELFERNRLVSTLTIDVGDVALPVEPLSVQFTYRAYFDITLKLRGLE